MAESLHDVVLFLADISGYTVFMRNNAEALAHSQTVITRLLEAILDELRSPLTVSKLEGDAVFFYCLKPVPEGTPGEARAVLGARLTAAREASGRTVAELARSRYCACDACRGIENLRVKFVAHSGRAMIHNVRHFQELAGVDVIVVHRLLQNSVGAARDHRGKPRCVSARARSDPRGVEVTTLRAPFGAIENAWSARLA